MAQRTELLDTYKIPTYAICPLEYGDYSGDLTEEDIHNIKTFDEKISGMCPKGYILDWDRESLDSPSFTRHPEFGLAMDCVELRVYKINENEPANHQSPQIYHCDKCGSTNVTLATAWCNYCDTHTTLSAHSQFMEQIESWWKDDATGEDYEVITGLDDNDFSLENDGKEFTDACNAIWNAKSDEEKIEIWKTITHREEYE